MMQKVPVKILREGAALPTYGTASSAGADLRACLDAPVVLAPGETRLIPIGIAMEIPEGYVGLVFARSGLASRRVKPLSIFASIYVEVFRATPMLVQLFIIYYIVFGGVSLPSFKLFGFIRFERFLPGVISLALNSAAYLSEIIRAGIQSIDPGQSEAARSLGLTRRQTLQSIVLPQAIKNILPAIANEFVTIIKESSICYTIGVQEIMSAVNSVKSATFSIGEPLIIAACVYFCLTFPTSKIIQYFERRMSRGDRR